MKKYLIVFPVLALFLLMACGPAKMAVDPYVGAWTVTIMDTPEGDVGSVMTIIKADDGGYEASVTSDMGDFMLQNLTIVNNKLSSGLEVGEMDFDFTGTFSGDNFSGSVSGPEGDYKAEGKRQVEKM